MIWYIITSDRNTIYWTNAGRAGGFVAFVQYVNDTYKTNFSEGQVLTSNLTAGAIVNRNPIAQVHFVP